MNAALSGQTVREIARVAISSGRSVRLRMRGCSMLPLLREPMVLEVAPLTGRGNVGEVIVFAQGELQVAHRVIGYAGQRYLTSGDAQPLITEAVAPADVLGRVESVWHDASASARRVDVGSHRLRGLWFARAHPVRRLAAGARSLAGRALRRLARLAQRSRANTLLPPDSRRSLEIYDMSDSVATTAGSLEIRAAGNDVIVHDTANGRVHVLNRTAAYILQSCDGQRDAAVIAAELTSRTGAPNERTLPDVERVLGELRALDLVH